jgi:hypothetical protein
LLAVVIVVGDNGSFIWIEFFKNLLWMPLKFNFPSSGHAFEEFVGLVEICVFYNFCNGINNL